MFGFGSLIAAEFVVGSHEGGADGDGNAADRRCHASGIHRAGTERKKNQDRIPPVRACTEYVETNVLNRIRVKDIADEIGYTENYISSVFKAEMGMSLLERCLIKLRG